MTQPRKNRHHRRHRPDAVVFPPDPKETGPQVVSRIYQAFGLTDRFPKEVRGQVQKLIHQDPAQDASLVDYTALPFITIDNDHSMDLDQAMYICREALPYEKDEQGYWVSYALADGAYFVPPFMPLFDHALQHGGASFYLPGKCIPMLPRELSEDHMSLNPNVIRRALVFDIRVDEKGRVLRTNYTWARIRSRWKGTYRETSEYYNAVDDGQPEKSPHSKKVYRETLDLLREVGTLRRQLAAERDVVNYTRNDVGISIDSSDNLIFTRRTHYISELYNEQISLLVNSEGAKLLAFLDELEAASQKDLIHPIYRTQSGPRDDQVRTLESVVANTIRSHGLDLSEWEWKKENLSIAAYLGRLHQHLNSLPMDCIEYHRWSPVVRVIERQAMITNVAADFSATPAEGHHSLKTSHYARFSAPMRELVGCFTHKELREAHTGQFISPNLSAATDIALRDNVIRAARRAKATQKKLNGALHLHMLNTFFYRELDVHPQKRTTFAGVIMGMDFSERSKSRRVYVQLEDPAVEIKVYGEDLDYHYNCRYGALEGTFNDFGSTISIGPLLGSFREDTDDESLPPSFKAGDRVAIRVGDYAKFYGQSSRSRWIFIMLEQRSVELTNVAAMHRASIRNSIVDRDLDALRNDDNTSTGSSNSFSDSDSDA